MYKQTHNNLISHCHVLATSEKKQLQYIAVCWGKSSSDFTQQIATLRLIRSLPLTTSQVATPILRGRLSTRLRTWTHFGVAGISQGATPNYNKRPSANRFSFMSIFQYTIGSMLRTKHFHRVHLFLPAILSQSSSQWYWSGIHATGIFATSASGSCDRNH